MKIRFGTKNESLIQLCRKGDEKAQYEVYRSYSKAMYNVAIRLTSDRETAQDILQESFVKAFQEIEKLNDENAFGGWLKKIVINRCFDEIRRKKHVFDFEMITEKHAEIAEEIDETVDIEVVHLMIKKLPGGAREILVLRAIEGLKFGEIAEQLGITESTAKTQFFRAKQLLAKMINKWENETGCRTISEGKPVEA